MTQRAALAAFAIVCIVGIGTAWYIRTPHFTEGSVGIRGIQFTVEIADSAADRAQGLQNRATLEPKHGMLFRFSQPGKYPIWMKQTNIPLDILWIAEGRIVYLKKNVQPQPGAPDRDLVRYLPTGAADMVLELNAGEIEQFGIKKGDAVAVQ